MTTITTLHLGALAANCHIIPCGGNACAVTDIGGDPERLLAALAQAQLQLHAILLTHGHFDHIGGVEAVRQATGAKVYIHEADAPMLTDAGLNLARHISMEPFTPVSTWETVAEGTTMQVADRTFQVLHTPGHTKGSVCYLTEDLLFSGDTLFRGSMGRTDFPGGSMQEMAQSLQRLKAYDGDLRVYPGHDAGTTLERERQTNPYMRSV